jgi:2-polyprenyl-3-methyl-5-hydroxy-6-metoxy-1,4-benzoquinol methylase
MTATSLCACCGASNAQFLFRGYGFDRSEECFDLYECSHCGLVRIEPPLSRAALARYYTADYYGSPVAKFSGPVEALMRLDHPRRARWLARFVSGPPPRRALDIGCGRGLFLRALAKLGFTAVGTELPGFAFTTAADDVEYLHASAEALPFADASFDLVSIWHVLEHTTDPAAVLHGIARVLKPGGIVAVAVPNFGSWQARHFGRHWFHLDLPRHLYHFRLSTLRRLLAEQHIEVIEVRTQSWDQNLYGFLQSWLNRIYWKSAPNGLYQVLKKRQVGIRGQLARLPGYLLLCGLAAPCAVMENLISTWRGEGATLVVIGRKTPSSRSP